MKFKIENKNISSSKYQIHRAIEKGLIGDRVLPLGTKEKELRIY